MKKKYKIIICSMICFVLCFGMSLSVYADNSGVLYEDFDIDSTYIESYPYYTSSRLQSYAQANNLPSDFDFFNSFPGLFDSGTSYIARNNLMDDIYNFDTYIGSVNNLDVSSLPIMILSPSAASSWICWARVSGEGKLALVGNYLVSDSSFTIYYTWGENNSMSPPSDYRRFTTAVVDTADANGLYKKHIHTQLINNTALYLVFTDLPMYIPTISGNSGYIASNGNDVANFTFLADNINYNYLLLDGIVSDPQAPITPSDNMWDEAKNYLNFRMTSYFIWDSDTKKFYHNMDFQWNENMLLNPDYYYLNCYYYITYKDSTMPAAITYQYPAIVRNLLDMAYARKTDIGKVPYRYSLGLFPDEFYDQNDNTWLSAYLSTIHRVVGTDTQYVNINDFWDNGAQIWDWGTDFLWSSGRKLQYVKPIIGDNIEEFTIHCIVNVGRSADPIGASGQQDFISGSYTAYHDCLSGKTTVTSTENATNLYPPEEGQSPSQIAKEQENGGTSISGGNHATAQGGNANVTVNTADNPFKNWSPEAVASLKETWDTIKDELDAHKDNSFMALMVESYKIIPDPLWQVIILCGSVISIFAVVRFIRNR